MTAIKLFFLPIFLIFVGCCCLCLLSLQGYQRIVLVRIQTFGRIHKDNYYSSSNNHWQTKKWNRPTCPISDADRVNSLTHLIQSSQWYSSLVLLWYNTFVQEKAHNKYPMIPTTCYHFLPYPAQRLNLLSRVRVCIGIVLFNLLSLTQHWCSLI